MITINKKVFSLFQCYFFRLVSHVCLAYPVCLTLYLAPCPVLFCFVCRLTTSHAAQLRHYIGDAEAVERAVAKFKQQNKKFTVCYENQRRNHGHFGSCTQNVSSESNGSGVGVSV